MFQLTITPATGLTTVSQHTCSCTTGKAFCQHHVAVLYQMSHYQSLQCSSHSWNRDVYFSATEVARADRCQTSRLWSPEPQTMTARHRNGVTCQFGSVPRGCVLSYQAPVVMGTSSTSVTSSSLILSQSSCLILLHTSCRHIFKYMQMSHVSLSVTHIESLEEVNSEDTCRGVWDPSREWRSRHVRCNIWLWTVSCQFCY